MTAADGEVTEFVEKPPAEPPGDTINAGTYVLDPDVLAAVPPGREVSIEREVFPPLVGHGLFGFAQDCRWIDIGTPASYLEANLEAARAKAGWSTPLRSIAAGAQVISARWSGLRAEVGAGAQGCPLGGAGRRARPVRCDRGECRDQSSQGVVW